MSKVLIEDSTLTDIADSIRNKNGTETTYKPSEMSSAIDNIPSGGISENAAKIQFDSTTERDVRKYITEFVGLNLNGRTDISYLFKDMGNLKKIEFTNTNGLYNMASTFSGSAELVSIEGLNTSAVSDWGNTFKGCTKLKTISNINTASATGFSGAFDGCSALEELPIMSLGQIYFMSNTFRGCDSLTNESLNNILYSLSRAYNVSSKTLRAVGLSEAQATTCTTLSNWSVAQSAGWSTGY